MSTAKPLKLGKAEKAWQGRQGCGYLVPSQTSQTKEGTTIALGTPFLGNRLAYHNTGRCKQFSFFSLPRRPVKFSKSWTSAHCSFTQQSFVSWFFSSIHYYRVQSHRIGQIPSMLTIYTLTAPRFPLPTNLCHHGFQAIPFFRLPLELRRMVYQEHMQSFQGNNPIAEYWNTNYNDMKWEKGPEY